MTIHTINKTLVIRASMEECWSFFSSPANLGKITPPELDFRVISEEPARIYPGLMIRYRVRPLLGIPVTWLTEITHVRENEYFSDEQRVGPYAIWHHEHFFQKLDDSHVEIRDLVHYALPFWLVGDLVHALVVKRQIENIFEFREKSVRELFPD